MVCSNIYEVAAGFALYSERHSAGHATDEEMPFAASVGHRSMRRKQRQKGHTALQSGAAGGEKNA